MNCLFLLEQIVGLNTNINFLSSLCEHGHFKKGDVHTDFIKVGSIMTAPMDCFPSWGVLYVWYGNLIYRIFKKGCKQMFGRIWIGWPYL